MWKYYELILFLESLRCIIIKMWRFLVCIISGCDERNLILEILMDKLFRLLDRLLYFYSFLITTAAGKAFGDCELRF